MPMRPQTLDEMRWLVRASRAPRIRSLREFAESEIIIPEGRREGTKFRADTLPWQRLWFDAIDSGLWRRFVLTACVQGGKTLVGWVIPILWHVFEVKENWGAGVPSMDIAGDKWRLELLPTIMASPRLRELLPQHGKGSKGGSFESIKFLNGVTLKFLSGHGGDEKRSAITLRGSAVTEADRVDTAGDASREAAPIYQIEARSASFGDDARLYAECTSTIPTGFVARERRAGSDSTIMMPCVHCGEFVSPEREHLVGWEDAENELQAAEQAAWICPHCTVILGEDDRRQMCEAGCLVHRGQTIDRDGVIHGERPQTVTLGFRANAFQNLLWPAGYIAGEEWRARREQDGDSAEKKLRQWFWALPVQPNEIDVTPLTQADVIGRQCEALTRGVVPPGTFAMSGGADLRKRQLHFVVIAWHRAADGQVQGHVVEAAILPIASDTLGIKRGLLTALRTLREKHIEPGYLDRAGRRWWPGWFPIDAFWFGTAVRQFVRESKGLGIKRYIPSFGRGLSAEQGRGRYQQPTEEGPKKPHVGDQFYIAWHERYALHAMIVNADHWKGFVREGFSVPDVAGSLTVFEATTEDEHKVVTQFAKEVAAERAVEIAVPERGMVTTFVNDSRRPNHFGDATYNACAAGALCGVRIAEPHDLVVAAAIERSAPPPGLAMPDGRPFFIHSREE